MLTLILCTIPLLFLATTFNILTRLFRIKEFYQSENSRLAFDISRLTADLNSIKYELIETADALNDLIQDRVEEEELLASQRTSAEVEQLRH